MTPDDHVYERAVAASRTPAPCLEIGSGMPLFARLFASSSTK